jgi:putative transposase
VGFSSDVLLISTCSGLKGEDGVNILNRIAAQRGLPASVKVDNDSEFNSEVMDKWAYERGVELDFSRPGTPPITPRWKASTADFARLERESVLSDTTTTSKISTLGQYYFGGTVKMVPDSDPFLMCWSRESSPLLPLDP